MDLTLPAGRGAVPAARRWARDQARALGAEAHVIPLVELLTSELVANAVIHGGNADIHVRVNLAGQEITVAVSDASDALPVMRTTGPEVVGGQGMRLVERLSSRWGVDRHHSGGKTVWFSLPTSA